MLVKFSLGFCRDNVALFQPVPRQHRYRRQRISPDQASESLRGPDAWRLGQLAVSWGCVKRFALACAAALLLTACPSKPTPKGPTGSGNGSGSGSTAAVPTKPVAPVEGLPCVEQPCMFHAGSGEHHQCLNSAKGACFQYGRRCVPASKCMQDGTGLYRACTKPTAGGCETWGAVCEPANGCSFDATSRTYRACSSWKDGRCAAYSDACSPGA